MSMLLFWHPRNLRVFITLRPELSKCTVIRHLRVYCLKTFDIVVQGKREENREKGESDEAPKRLLE